MKEHLQYWQLLHWVVQQQNLQINQVSLYEWNGATVRSGIFDDPNGIYWEYDGQQTNAVQRTATRQLAGVVTVHPIVTQWQELVQDLENKLKQVIEL